MGNLKFAVHPGRILRDEFLTPLGVSAGRLAVHIGVPRTRIERLAKEETSMTVDTAARLAAAFNTSPQFWLNLQTNYEVAKMKTPDNIAPLRELAVLRAG